MHPRSSHLRSPRQDFTSRVDYLNYLERHEESKWVYHDIDVIPTELEISLERKSSP